MSLDLEEEKEPASNIDISDLKARLEGVLGMLGTSFPKCSAHIRHALRIIAERKVRVLILYNSKKYRVSKRKIYMNEYLSKLNMTDLPVVREKYELVVPITLRHVTEVNINDFCTLEDESFDTVTLDRKLALFTMCQYFLISEEGVIKLILSIFRDVLQPLATIMQSPVPPIESELDTHAISFSVWSKPKQNVHDVGIDAVPHPTTEFLTIFMEMLKDQYRIEYNLFEISHESIGTINTTNYTCKKAVYLKFVSYLRDRLPAPSDLGSSNRKPNKRKG